MIVERQSLSDILSVFTSGSARGFSRSLLVTLLACAFISSRAVYLDQDAPPWLFTYYQPIDELYYSISGFNLFHYGHWLHNVFDFLPADNSPFNALQSVATSFSLVIFGNTFIGVRMPAVACGLLVFLGTLHSLSKIPGTASSPRHLIVGLAALYMLSDFFFLESSRINDPTTFIMAGIAICMLIVLAGDYGTSKRANATSFVLGLTAVGAVAFIYVYAIYITAALGTTAFLSHYRHGPRAVAANVISFALGAGVSALLFYLFLRYCFQTDFADALRALIVGGGKDRNEFVSAGIVPVILKNLPLAWEQTASQNLFKYNPALLFAYLICLPLFAIYTIRNRRPIDIFVICCIIFRFLLSSVIPNDYSEKKLIQTFPIVVYVIGATLLASPSIYKDVFGNRFRWILIYFCIATFLVIYVSLRSRLEIEAAAPFSNQISTRTLWPFFLVLLLFPIERLRTLSAISLTLIMLIPGLRLSQQFLYGDPTFMYRDSLIRVAPKLNGKIIAGGLSFAVRLYNTSTPVMNFYRYYVYGDEKFADLSKQLYENKLAAGTILYVPFHPTEFFKPIHAYVNAGGLVLDEVLDIRDVEQKYKLAFYVVPVARE